MTQNEKDLLIKDLCSRLPYGVVVGTTDNDGSLENVWEVLWYNTFTEDVKLTHSIEDADKLVDISEVKPYLFPLSSMTDEQKKEYDSIIYHNIELHWERYYNVIDVDCYEELYDFYNKNHFDYRGLIPMGLAEDATGKNIY